MLTERMGKGGNTSHDKKHLLRSVRDECQLNDVSDFQKLALEDTFELIGKWYFGR